MTPADRRAVAGVVLYYVLMGLTLWALFRWVPGWAELFAGARLAELSAGAEALSSNARAVVVQAGLASALIAMGGALLVVIPVAWVYVITKHGLGYDPSVVQTLVILPIAVAGMILIVQSTLALAFSLAGITAAVRFRNTLKDTKDAVYVFVAIGVGLASGVQAFAVTLVMSITFNLVVLALWGFNVGGIYATRIAALPSDAALGAEGDEKPFQGLLKVTANDVESAASLLETIFEENVKRWKQVGTITTDDVAGQVQYFIRFKKKQPPEKVLALIQQRGINLDLAAEFEALTD